MSKLTSLEIKALCNLAKKIILLNESYKRISDSIHDVIHEQITVTVDLDEKGAYESAKKYLELVIETMPSMEEEMNVILQHFVICESICELR
ncbi:hypothetical protein [Shewanella algae]|uniref:Uncharacterized protein n=1 Tax=Shewanella algae TaxID=38313 RepID=A0A7T8IQA5_9GAMM|nr:hypothetical protein D7032_13165 [Shewanella algae]